MNAIDTLLVLALRLLPESQHTAFLAEVEAAVAASRGGGRA